MIILKDMLQIKYYQSDTFMEGEMGDKQHSRRVGEIMQILVRFGKPERYMQVANISRVK